MKTINRQDSMKKPSSHPSSYQTLKGLLSAVERCLFNKVRGNDRLCGMSAAMWLKNAEFYAEKNFSDVKSIPALREKYTITRPQDLVGPHSCFGIPLPKRDYIVGDNIPGVGRIAEVYGDQYRIGSEWFNKRCFEPEVANAA